MAHTGDQGLQAIDVMIKVVKGNELTSLIVEDHAAGEFQPNLYDGKDLNKAVMVSNQLAVLGVRKDYFLLQVPYDLVTGTADITPKNNVYLDLVEFTSVPPEVQYDVFGEFSPFVTPRIAVDEDMIDGIDRQEFGMITNVGFMATIGTTGTTGVEQKIRGIADSRVTAYYDGLDPSTAATNGDAIAYVKIKPNDDGVFLIPEGGILWIDNSDDGFGETAT